MSHEPRNVTFSEAIGEARCYLCTLKATTSRNMTRNITQVFEVADWDMMEDEDKLLWQDLSRYSDYALEGPERFRDVDKSVFDPPFVSLPRLPVDFSLLSTPHCCRLLITVDFLLLSTLYCCRLLVTVHFSLLSTSLLSIFGFCRNLAFVDIWVLSTFGYCFR